MRNHFPVRRQKIILPQFLRQHPLHPLKRRRRDLSLHRRRKKVNLDLLPKMRILMPHPRNLPAFRQRHAQLLPQLSSQRLFQRLSLTHLPSRKFPLQPRRILPPPLPYQHPPVPPLNHRRHHLSHSSPLLAPKHATHSLNCHAIIPEMGPRTFGVRRLAAAFTVAAQPTNFNSSPALPTPPTFIPAGAPRVVPGTPISRLAFRIASPPSEARCLRPYASSGRGIRLPPFSSLSTFNFQPLTSSLPRSSSVPHPKITPSELIIRGNLSLCYRTQPCNVPNLALRSGGEQCVPSSFA